MSITIRPASLSNLGRLLLPALVGLLLIACQAVQAAPSQPVDPTATQAARQKTQTNRPTVTTTPTPTAAPSRTAAPTPTSPPTATATLPPTPTPDGVYFPVGEVKVPILMYHNISDKGNTPYILRVADFRNQMKLLAESGYQTVTISELADVMRNGGYLPEKPVVITFDDGFLNVYTNAFPIMEAYRFRGVAYLISGTLDSDLSYGYLQVPEIEELVESGWEIGSHSISHSSLKTTALGLRNEVEGSKEDLEEKLGIPVHSFSYPYNIANAWIRERVEEYGYESAVGVDIFNHHPPERLYFLSRRAVLRGISLQAFRVLLDKGGE